MNSKEIVREYLSLEKKAEKINATVAAKDAKLDLLINTLKGLASKLEVVGGKIAPEMLAEMSLAEALGLCINNHVDVEFRVDYDSIPGEDIPF